VGEQLKGELKMLTICNNFNTIVTVNTYTRVGGTQIDTDGGDHGCGFVCVDGGVKGMWKEVVCRCKYASGLREKKSLGVSDVRRCSLEIGKQPCEYDE
jgi:hypothetical protein